MIHESEQLNAFISCVLRQSSHVVRRFARTVIAEAVIGIAERLAVAGEFAQRVNVFSDVRRAGGKKIAVARMHEPEISILVSGRRRIMIAARDEIAILRDLFDIFRHGGMPLPRADILVHHAKDDVVISLHRFHDFFDIILLKLHKLRVIQIRKRPCFGVMISGIFIE